MLASELEVKFLLPRWAREFRYMRLAHHRDRPHLERGPIGKPVIFSKSSRWKRGAELSSRVKRAAGGGGVLGEIVGHVRSTASLASPVSTSTLSSLSWGLAHGLQLRATETRRCSSHPGMSEALSKYTKQATETRGCTSRPGMPEGLSKSTKQGLKS